MPYYVKRKDFILRQMAKGFAEIGGEVYSMPEKRETREVSYKLAVKLLNLMLKNGFLLPEEYEEIDALNRLTFEPELSKVYG